MNMDCLSRAQVLLRPRRNRSAFFFFKQKTAYEIKECDWIQTCALPISVPLTNCDQLLAAAGQFDGLDDLLTNLKDDPFADAFDVYIRDIERLDSEGRELAQRIREIGRNDCKPYMSEYSRWTLADADFRDSGS